mmetsp:Transcript_49304/g.91249  ORF Transcript_49304/g.91249 Transcript_49304/m.91249 type:complete len:85 (-) Transcript_49304:536-790(-)
MHLHLAGCVACLTLGACLYRVSHRLTTVNKMCALSYLYQVTYLYLLFAEWASLISGACLPPLEFVDYYLPHQLTKENNGMYVLN